MPSAEQILQRMKALQADREKAIGPLAEVMAKRSALVEQLAALDEPYGKAYVAAVAAGWTADELSQLGADEPVRRPKGRPRKARSSAPKTAAQPSSPAPETASPAASVPPQEGPRTQLPPTQGPPIPTRTSV